jgi:pimeloyl-ACP methyl ester carboxylesterase
MKAAITEARKTDPDFTFARDGIHPNENGHRLMARQVYAAWGLRGTPDDVPGEVLAIVREKQRILKEAWMSHVGHKRPGVKPGLPIEEAKAKAAELDKQARETARKTGPLAPALPGKKSVWNGHTRNDFDFHGNKATIVAPNTAAPGKPWLWHGEFFGHIVKPDIALLDRGFHIAYLSLPDRLGSPEAVKTWNAFYADITTRFNLSKKPALQGLSRGGLYCYNWAIANPGKVSCIYADAPVWDFKSWPGGKGKGKGDPKNWTLVLTLWGFKDEAEALAAKVNPVDHLAPLAKAKVPLLHVFGDADDVVPWEENTGLIAERYQKLGGSIELIRKPGVGHHPHGLDDPAPIVSFIFKHASAAR